MSRCISVISPGNNPMSVFAPGLINLWNSIESYGVDPAPFFEAENVHVQLPIDPCMRVAYETIDRIRAKAVTQIGDEAFGIRAAACYLPSQLGALGYAWLASLTLRRACLRLERFIQVINDKAVVRVEDKGTNMVVSLILDNPSESIFARDDSGLALLTAMSRSICGDRFRLDAVNFRHAEPRDPRPYFELFSCELKFNQADNHCGSCPDRRQPGVGLAQRPGHYTQTGKYRPQ